MHASRSGARLILSAMLTKAYSVVIVVTDVIDCSDMLSEVLEKKRYIKENSVKKRKIYTKHFVVLLFNSFYSSEAKMQHRR